MIWVYKEKPKKEWKKFFAFIPVPVSRLVVGDNEVLGEKTREDYGRFYSAKFPIQDGDEVAWLCWVERKWLDSYEGSSRYEYKKIRKVELSEKE